jgi:hypothetical protein
VFAIISKFTFKITTQVEHKLFVLPVYQFFQFMPSNFTDAPSSNIGLWLQLSADRKIPIENAKLCSFQFQTLGQTISHGKSKTSSRTKDYY